MISATNGIYNNQPTSLYLGRTQIPTQRQTPTTNQNSNSKSIVAINGRKLSEMVLAIKQAKATNAQSKVQNVFQKLAEKIQNSSLKCLI